MYILNILDLLRDYKSIWILFKWWFIITYKSYTRQRNVVMTTYIDGVYIVSFRVLNKKDTNII